MQIVHNMNIHLDRREQLPAIDAVQGETGRVLSVTLFENGELWPIPENTHAVLRYGKADMTGGIFDTLPGGENACTISGSTVTVAVPAQLLTAAGFTRLQILLCCGENLLSTFTILVRVEADPSADTTASEDYVNLLPGLVEAAALATEAADAASRAAVSADAAMKEAKITASSITSRYELSYTPHWVDEETGALVSSTVTVTSQLFPVLGSAVGLAFPATHAVRLCYYDRHGSFLGKDTLCYESFQRIGITADYARVEAIAANGSEIEVPQAFASQIAVYIPAPGLADVERAVVAASEANISAAQAEESSLQAAASAKYAHAAHGYSLGRSFSHNLAVYPDSDCFTVKVRPAVVNGEGETRLLLEKSERNNTAAVRQACFVDFRQGRMGFYGKCSDFDTLNEVSAKSVELPLVAGREYAVQMIRCSDGGATLRITDCCTLKSDALSAGAEAIGNGWGLRRWLFVDNGALGDVTAAHCHILQPENPRVLVVGDELVEARTLTDQGFDAANRFAALMRQELGGSCFINARSGATAQMVAGWFDSYLSDVCKPVYTVIAVGGSDTDYAAWVEGMQTIIAKTQAMGAVPVLMTLPVGVGANKNILTMQNAWIRHAGYAYIDANLVTSMYFEGESPDPWQYLQDGLHLNVRGHKHVFLRAKLDVPEMMG